MAGAGYKLFTTGSVLTAADVNTYLNEQSVMRFANATARTTALSGVLAEGMMSYLDDTNTVEVYNGSAWVSVGSTGDITAVTTAANSGLTGGATSGDVALRINTTAKGSIIAGTGASTLGELTVGTNNQVLTADSTTATGLKWATPAGGGGKVLQVVQGTTSTSVSSSSATYASTGLSASITPSSTSSKVLVLYSVQGAQKTSGNLATSIAMRLRRGGTDIHNLSSDALYTATTLLFYGTTMSAAYLDSPSTTSSTTYEVFFANLNNTSSISVQVSGANSVSTIVLMEIGA